MSESGTLSELIAAAKFNLRWFDLGRRVQSVPRATAEAFEAGHIPWPFPYLRQAWTGLLLWPQEGGEPIVWFLRLPLDEQGKLQLSVRDAFVRQLSQNLDQSEPAASAAQLDRALSDSGLMFTPSAERQASFHTRAATLLKRPASSHYGAAREYFEQPEKHSWDQLGIQGIADLAARWETEKGLLQKQIAKLAPPVFIGLCQCLENEKIDHQLAQSIVRRAEMALADKPADFTLVAAAVRGISNAPAEGMRRDFLYKLLNGPAATHGEIIAAIGSRCPQDLARADIAAHWLAALAEHQKQDTFNLLLTDLMYLPAVRTALLGALRDPSRPESLAGAFGRFLHGSHPTH